MATLFIQGTLHEHTLAQVKYGPIDNTVHLMQRLLFYPELYKQQSYTSKFINNNWLSFTVTQCWKLILLYILISY